MRNNYDKQKLLVRVAKMYYEDGMNQEAIANKLNISRPYISKLLTVAKQEGLIRVQVIDPLNLETSLEKEFRERFHLKKAIITPHGNEGHELEECGKAAARYLDTILKNDDIIGTSWGGTLREISHRLIKRTDLKNLFNVQLCGGVSNVNNNVHAAEIATNFASTLGSTAYMMQVPAIVDTERTKELLQRDSSIASVFALGLKANIAVITAGAWGVNSALLQAGYISESQMKNLSSQGAVGDICSHVIDINGQIVDQDLDNRTMAVSLDNIRKKEYRIGAAIGLSKVNSLCGLLNGGIANVLVTNELTAEKILEKLD